jgi:hypothetical protein
MATETLTKTIVDCATGELTTMPLTAQELAQRETDRLAYEAMEAERIATEEKLASDKAAGIEALKSLGLTDDQITALVGK